MALTSLLFLAAYGAGLAAAIFRHPNYGLYTYVAVFYLHPPDRWWGATLPELRWSLIAAVVTMLATWQKPVNPKRETWMSSSAAKILLVFTIWFWIQLLWALDFDLHFEAAIIFTKYLVLFYVIYRLLDNKEACWGFAAANLAGCAFLGMLILDAPPGRLDGVGGPGIDSANTLSAQLVFGLMIAGAMILRGPVWLRLLALVSIPFIANGVIQTQTRGALFGLIGGGLALLVLMPKVNRKLLYVLGLLSGVVLLQTVPDNFWERMDTIVVAVEDVTGLDLIEQAEEETQIDNSSLSRVVLLGAQWEMFKANPFGIGHRGTAVLSSKYLAAEYLDRGSRSSHNTLMSALVEQGVIGAMLFIGLVIWVFRSCSRLKALDQKGLDPDLSVMRAGVCAAMISVLVAGNFVDLLKAEMQLWLLTWMAVLWDICQRSLAEESRDQVQVERGRPPHRLARRH